MDNQRGTTPPGLRISHSDAVTIKDFARAGRGEEICEVIDGLIIDGVIADRRAEIDAELIGKAARNFASQNHRWSPGPSKAHNGYVKIRVGKGHPLSDSKGYAYEHHVVWRSAGMTLPKGYVVHHRNGDKTDNRIENLEAISREEHSAEHARRDMARCPKSGRFTGSIQNRPERAQSNRS